MALWTNPLTKKNQTVLNNANRMKTDPSIVKTSSPIVGQFNLGGMSTVQSSPKQLGSWEGSMGLWNSIVTNLAQSKTVTKTVNTAMTDNKFLDSATRGIIKLIKEDGTSVTLLAEDVTVQKKLPLSTSENMSGSDVSVSQTDGQTSDTSGQGQQQQQEATLIIKCKLTITPTGMSRQAFKEKRANYLFDFEDKTFTAVSDMFRKALDMQFTDLQYVIPAGEVSAQYQVEMTQITKAEDDRTSKAQLDNNADYAKCYSDAAAHAKTDAEIDKAMKDCADKQITKESTPK